MTTLNVLELIGGLCLFLFGMNTMGEALERRAGNRLQAIIGKLTTKRFTGFLTGMAVTAIIQSSSATTVMVVGFVNSGLMTLKQAINVIIGANVGTTITSWILSLSGISSSNIWVQLFKPSSFSPILALIGIILYMFLKSSKHKDTGLILLGFSTLMFGMDAMSAAVSGLKSSEAFQELFIMFSNPILGVIAGALLTAIIQSSSASVGILQALSSTGKINFASAIPIIMGQNIGTCVTALISSVGTNKNARRTAVVHLSFNIIGTVVCLIIFTAVKAIFSLDGILKGMYVGHLEIALVHTAFNALCTALLLPASGLLEKLALKVIPENQMSAETKKEVHLDQRLLEATPIALRQARATTVEMAEAAKESIYAGLDSLFAYDSNLATKIRDYEDLTDRYEDAIGTYLVKLSGMNIGDDEGAEAASLLRLIGDFERISDHSVNLVESAEEMRDKKLVLSQAAKDELTVLCNAVKEIIDLSFRSFTENDVKTAMRVEPLEELIDSMKEELRRRHISRLQVGDCSIEAGFVLSDLLTNIERCADHCSNIAFCVIDRAGGNLDMHKSLLSAHENSESFDALLREYSEKYSFVN